MFTKREVDTFSSVYTFLYERAPTFTLQEVYSCKTSEVVAHVYVEVFLYHFGPSSRLPDLAVIKEFVTQLAYSKQWSHLSSNSTQS